MVRAGAPGYEAELEARERVCANEVLPERLREDEVEHLVEEDQDGDGAIRLRVRVAHGAFRNEDCESGEPAGGKCAVRQNASKRVRERRRDKSEYSVRLQHLGVDSVETRSAVAFEATDRSSDRVGREVDVCENRVCTQPSARSAQALLEFSNKRDAIRSTNVRWRSEREAPFPRGGIGGLVRSTNVNATRRRGNRHQQLSGLRPTHLQHSAERENRARSQ